MLGKVLTYINYCPFWQIIGILFVALFIVISIQLFLFNNKNLYKWYKLYNISLLICNILLIVYTTVISRIPGEIREFSLVFSLLQKAKIEPTIYRSIFMNIIAFIPYGIFRCAISKSKRKYVVTIFEGLLFSVLIETVQYVWKLGITEVDDVLCNVLGVCCGAVIYWIETNLIMLNYNKKL